MTFLLIVAGFVVVAFGLMTMGLKVGNYKQQEEDSDRCFACPIRMLVKYPCHKDERHSSRRHNHSEQQYKKEMA